VGHASATYFQTRLTAVQQCRNAFNAGRPLFTDRAKTLPLASPDACPTEYATARTLQQAARTLHASLARRCTNTQVVQLAACAPSVAGLVAADGQAGCLLSATLLLADEYGEVLQPAQRAARTCQEAIATAGQRYASRRLETVQGCRNGLVKGQALFLDRARTLPVTSVQECAAESGARQQIARAAAARQEIAKPHHSAAGRAAQRTAPLCLETSRWERADGLLRSEATHKSPGGGRGSACGTSRRLGRSASLQPKAMPAECRSPDVGRAEQQEPVWTTSATEFGNSTRTLYGQSMGLARPLDVKSNYRDEHN
jgi:hypothetical protein